MTKFLTKILAPFLALIASIIGLIELISALNRIKTGLEVFLFISGTTSSVIKNYNDFVSWRDGLQNQIFQTIFTFFPILHGIPDVVWRIISAAMFLYIAYILLKWYAES